MITREQIEACIDRGVTERQPIDGKHYVGLLAWPSYQRGRVERRFASTVPDAYNQRYIANTELWRVGLIGRRIQLV
jgi:hypothetical protein